MANSSPFRSLAYQTYVASLDECGPNGIPDLSVVRDRVRAKVGPAELDALIDSAVFAAVAEVDEALTKELGNPLQPTLTNWIDPPDLVWKIGGRRIRVKDASFDDAIQKVEQERLNYERVGAKYLADQAWVNQAMQYRKDGTTTIAEIVAEMDRAKAKKSKSAG